MFLYSTCFYCKAHALLFTPISVKHTPGLSASCFSHAVALMASVGSCCPHGFLPPTVWLWKQSMANTVGTLAIDLPTKRCVKRFPSQKWIIVWHFFHFLLGLYLCIYSYVLCIRIYTYIVYFYSYVTCKYMCINAFGVLHRKLTWDLMDPMACQICGALKNLKPKRSKTYKHVKGPRPSPIKKNQKLCSRRA